MKVEPEVIRYEFIGTHARVARSTDPTCDRVSGVVMDETRNTFTLSDRGTRKTIMKDSTLFHFIFPDGTTVEIDGRLLTGRPEDRLKKSLRRLW